MINLIRSILIILALGLFVVTFDRYESPQAEVLTPQKVQDVNYLGPGACAECHSEIHQGYLHSGMTAALEGISDCSILRANPQLSFKNGKFTYRITRQGDKSIYSVSDGTETFSAPILYCFGQGKSGQTYVFDYSGSFYESRVSFYRGITGLDLTIGYAETEPKTVHEAAGRRMSRDETLKCFSCHSTGAVKNQQLQLEQLYPGVTCESCHGSGVKHVAAHRAGKPADGKMETLGKLDGDDMAQNMCGKCHRSVEDVVVQPGLTSGVNGVRFQPYRIFKSKCYSIDQRIGCTSCHDPHAAMPKGTAAYDVNCLSCHQTEPSAKSVEGMAPACRVGKNDCSSCHMQKIELPGAHFKFTDHYIRIVREGEPFPK